MFEILGFDFLGYATLAYGSFLLGAHFKEVKLNCVFAIVATVCSAVRTLVRYGIIALSDSGTDAIIRLAIEIVIVICYFAICFIFQWAVAKFARQNKAFKLERLANNIRYITGVYVLLRILMFVFTQTEFVSNFIVIATVLQYLVLLFNIYFIYSCFASITTPKLLEKELETDAEFEEKEKLKKERRKKLFDSNKDEE